MNEGDKRIKTEIVKRRKCEYCDELATKELTFLLPHCRSNPASSAYRQNDCSWCSDKNVFVCDEHDSKDRRSIADELGMEWCAAFPYENFKHRFLYWDVIKEELIIKED